MTVKFSAFVDEDSVFLLRYIGYTNLIKYRKNHVLFLILPLVCVLHLSCLYYYIKMKLFDNRVDFRFVNFIAA